MKCIFLLAFISFVFSATFVAAQQENQDEILNSVDSTRMWEKYRSELIMLLSKGRNNLETLQLLPTAMHVEWEKNSEVFQTFANSKITPGALWTLDQGTFTSAYEEFINAIDFKYSKQKPSPQLTHLYSIESDKEALYEIEFGKCLSKFASTHESIRGTYESYETLMCPAVSDAYFEFMKAKASAEHYGRKSYPSEKDFIAGRAIGKFAMSPNPNFIELTTLSDFVKRINQGKYDSFEMKIDSSTSNTRGTSSWKSTSFSLGFPGFFSIGFNSSKKKMSLTTNEEDYKITIGAQSWTAVRVVPNPTWFSGTFLKEWANGPYKKGYNRDYFFGPKGKMSLVAQTFYIISKPHVEMILNRQDAEEFASAKQSGFNISIGPIMFNMAKAKTHNKQSGKDNLFQFRIESTDPSPQLIAVKGDRLPF